MSSVERRERERNALRCAILDAAREILTTEDYESISMRRIADRIDYSATAIYLHFKDKAELMDALAAEGFEQLVGVLTAVNDEDPLLHLRHMAEACVEFLLTHRPYYRLMVQSSRRELYGDYTTRQMWSKRTAEVLDSAVSDVASRYAPNEDDNVHIAGRVFWAHLHGVISLIMADALGPYSPERLSGKAIDIAIAGLLAELGRPVTKR